MSLGEMDFSFAGAARATNHGRRKMDFLARLQSRPASGEGRFKQGHKSQTRVAKEGRTEVGRLRRGQSSNRADLALSFLSPSPTSARQSLSARLD